MRCLVDITLPSDAARADAMQAELPALTSSFVEQFPGVLRAPIEIGKKRQTTSGKYFVRIKFRIWPNRGGPIETSFRQEVTAAMSRIEEGFRDTRVVVNYEVDAQPVRS